MKNKQNGFTLVEILVYMGIMAYCLAALLLRTKYLPENQVQMKLLLRMKMTFIQRKLKWINRNLRLLTGQSKTHLF